MSVNAKLEAAEAHFGQSAETLSLCLQLRQRKTGLLRTPRTALWLTDEKEPRISFSDETVRDAVEAGFLDPGNEDDDGPLGATLTPEGIQVGTDVLAWLKAQNEPKPAEPEVPNGGDF